LRRTLLQQLDRDVVRRAHERHASVAWRPVDRHAHVHQALARRVDVVDLVRDVPEVPSLAVLLGIPVVRQLELRILLALGRDEHEWIPAGLVYRASQLLQTELAAVEIERLLDIADAQHRMQITQDTSSAPSAPVVPPAAGSCCDETLHDYTFYGLRA